jgi:hypothetical protein
MKTLMLMVLAVVVTAPTLASQTPDPKADSDTVVAQRFCPRGRC